MALYHLLTASHARTHYTVRAGTLNGETLVGWTPRKGAAALFRREEARKIARRMRRIRVRARVEKVA